ncbi:acyl-CoA thioesterase [Arthrobacter sp. GCM10027362]|uniref:acyl-CoA thioesterase n=1 Tax=Arthrobacter sp. GCM10027362 TaxID=3273379 RepID=UPI00363DD538
MGPHADISRGANRQRAAESFEEVCALLRPRPLGHGRYTGGTMSARWGVSYGGLLVAQALAAASADVPQGLWVRSLHAYFVEAGAADRGVEIDVVPIRDGRSTCWRSVRVRQAERLLLTADLTFARDSSSPAHQAPIPAVRPPEVLPNVGRVLADFDDVHVHWNDDSAFDLRYVDNPPRLTAREAGRDRPRSSVWVRAMGPDPNDRALNAALLAYASDMCMLDPLLKPHGLWWGNGSAKGFSMDHSMWFHAPARTDEWILVDQHSPALRDGRGLALADMFTRSGELLCSVAQQGSMRAPPPRHG